MIPSDVVALAKAISLHYTGKEDSWLEHVSTAHAFCKKLTTLGYAVITHNPTDEPADLKDESVESSEPTDPV